MNTVWAKVFVSGVTLTVALVALFGHLSLQPSVVILVLIAVLPWLGNVLETVELIGVGKVQLQRVQQQVQVQEERLNVQQDLIVKLVVYSMSHFIFTMLEQLYQGARNGGEYLYRDNGTMKGELRLLRDHGYIEHFDINDLRDGTNLIGRVKLTPVGNFLVELREQLQSADAAQAAEHLGERTRRA